MQNYALLCFARIMNQVDSWHATFFTELSLGLQVAACNSSYYWYCAQNGEIPKPENG